MIDITPEQRREIKRILASSAPGCRAYAYGSRVRGTARRYSDLNLALTSERTIVSFTLDKLKSQFLAAHLPFPVEIVNLEQVSDNFRKIILGQCEAL